MADSYEIPPWLTASGNMGAQYAQTYQNSRRLDQQKQKEQFEQGLKSSDEARKAEEFKQRNQKMATMMAEQQAYKQDIANGVDPKLAILNHPSVFSGRLPASIFAQPKPSAPTPIWVPPDVDAGSPGYFNAGGKPVFPPQTKNQPGFSLHPGETRFDATGKPIANLPPAVKASIVTPEVNDELKGLEKRRDNLQKKFDTLPAPGSEADDEATQVERRYLATEINNVHKRMTALRSPAAANPPNATAAAPKTESIYKAGTAVKNAKGEIKYLKTDGTLPEGWTAAQ